MRKVTIYTATQTYTDVINASTVQDALEYFSIATQGQLFSINGAPVSLDTELEGDEVYILVCAAMKAA